METMVHVLAGGCRQGSGSDFLIGISELRGLFLT